MVTNVATNATGSIIYAGPAYNNLQKSTDGGQTWSELTNSINGRAYYSLISSGDGQTVFVASSLGDTKLQKSIDGGNTWATIASYNTSNTSITSVAASSDNLIVYYSYQGQGIFKSTNGGSSWTNVLSGSGFWRSVSCSADGSVVAAVNGLGDPDKVYISVNGGTSWNQYGVASTHSDVFVSGNGGYIYVAQDSAPLYSFTNTAGVITQRPNTSFVCFSARTSYDGQIVFALTNNGTIYKSIDGGANFTSESVAPGVQIYNYSLTVSRTASKAYFGGGVMISYPNYSPRFYTYSGVGSDIQAATAPCFLADARVQTPSGPVAIAELQEGDLVLSAAGKPVRVQRVVAKTVEPTIQSVPYIIPAGTWGAQVDLPISPDHRVVVPQQGLVKASKLGLDRLNMTGPFTYYNLEVENCEHIIVEGVVVESLAHAKQYRLTMSEFAALVTRLERSGKRELAAKLVAKAQQQGATIHLPLYIQRK